MSEARHRIARVPSHWLPGLGVVTDPDEDCYVEVSAAAVLDWELGARVMWFMENQPLPI